MAATLKHKSFINSFGVLIMFAGSVIMAKGVVCSKSEILIQLDPQRVTFEDLEKLSLTDLHRLQEQGY